MRIRFLTAAVSALVLCAPVVAHAGPGGGKPPFNGPSLRTKVPVTAAREAGFGPATPVTLVTGDRLLVRRDKSGRTSVTVDPASARKGVAYHSSTTGKNGVRVVPSDAMPLLAAGRLDPRLFEVNGLIAAGYDDRKTGDVPVLTQRQDKKVRVNLRGGTVKRRLDRTGYDALRVSKRSARDTWKSLRGNGASRLGDGVRKLWLDGVRKVSDDRSNAQIGAPRAWANGATGAGVTVAVLDTGYDAGHPDLSGVVTQTRNFTTEAGMQDGYGHGTHVASIIAGSGAASNGRYKGVAPDAKLAIGKVCTSSGFCTDSAVLAGMEWAAKEVKAKVVNMSLGGPDEDGVDPLEEAVNRLTDPSLFVVAAGNSGEGGVESPGTADYALSVAAVDGNDVTAGFSSVGPRTQDQAVKPEITAPGVGIVAARAAGTSMGSPVDARYTAANGTSMATPHAAAVAAMLFQKHPDWPALYVKGTLAGNAKPLANQTLNQQGAGRLDAGAVSEAAFGSLGAGSGYLKWPHATGQTSGWYSLYQNGTNAAAELTLSLSATTESGAPAPAGTFTLGRDRFTVQPGKGDGTIVIAHGDAAPPGRYLATVTARTPDGKVVARSVIAAYVEPESYDVQLSVLNRYGQPAKGMGRFILKTGAMAKDFVLVDGKAKVRLPAGSFTATMMISDAANTYTVASAPVTVNADTALSVDGRQGVSVGHATDGANAVNTTTDIEVNVPGSVQTVSDGFVFSNPTLAAPLRIVPNPQSGVDYLARTIWHQNGAATSPYVYRLVDFRPGTGIPAAPSLVGRKAEMAHVTNDYRLQAAAGEIRYNRLSWVPSTGILLSVPPTLSAPQKQEEYLTPHQAVYWQGTVYLGNAARPFDSNLDDGVYTIPQAKDYGVENWHHAGLGPALPQPYAKGNYRMQDTFYIDARPMFSDWGVTFPGSSGFHHTGDDRNMTGTATLDRNGQRIATTDLANSTVFTWPVPTDDAAYTLSLSAARNVPYSTLSTKTETVWGFRSSRGTGYAMLPLVQPRLWLGGNSNFDGYNRVRTGTTTYVPFFVQAPDLSAPMTSGKIEVSRDDGTTWQQVPTTAGWYGMPFVSADSGIANTTPGYVSLRVTATDPAGNTVKTTIIRAYQVIA